MQNPIERELAALQQLSTGQLCERYAELYGEAARTRHKGYLVRKVAWRLQALAEGDLSERARRRAEELANDADVRLMPPKSPNLRRSAPRPDIQAPVSTDVRLPPPGAAIVRQYKGQTVRVMVLANGFEYEGRWYKSLSAVAKAATGSHYNGYRFFNLKETS